MMLCSKKANTEYNFNVSNNFPIVSLLAHMDHKTIFCFSQNMFGTLNTYTKDWKMHHKWNDLYSEPNITSKATEIRVWKDTGATMVLLDAPNAPHSWKSYRIINLHTKQVETIENVQEAATSTLPAIQHFTYFSRNDAYGNFYIYLFGGMTDANMYTNQMHVFSSKTMQFSSVSYQSKYEPIGRIKCASTYNAKYDCFLIHGGLTKNNSLLDDFWSFDCKSCKWTQILPFTPPNMCPPSLIDHLMVMCGPNRLYMFSPGEANSSTNVMLSNTRCIRFLYEFNMGNHTWKSFKMRKFIVYESLRTLGRNVAVVSDNLFRVFIISQHYTYGMSVRPEKEMLSLQLYSLLQKCQLSNVTIVCSE